MRTLAATEICRVAGIALVAMSTGLFGGCSGNVSDRDIEFVTLPQARELALDKPGTARFIDPRSPAEYAAGRIPGAVNLELPAVSDRADRIDPSLARFKMLVVYGNDPGSGVARAMTKRLISAGHKQVKMFPGGMAEWKGSGLKIEVSPPAPDAKPTSKPMNN